MKVKVENAGPCRKLLKLEVPVEQVNEAWDFMLALYTRNARVDGFRKGKAPAAVVTARFNKELAEGAGDRLLNSAYRQALEQEKISPVAVVNVEYENPVRGSVFQVSVTLDVPPEFKLPKYKGLSLRGNKVEISDEQVEEGLKKYLENMSEYAATERTTVMEGDAVRLSYSSKMDSTVTKELPAPMKGITSGDDIWWNAGSESNAIPGLGQALIGLNIGEPKTVTISFGNDYAAKALAGHSVEYTIQANGIMEKKKPVLDEAFLKQQGFETEAALRESIRQALLREAEREERANLRQLAIKTLLAKTSMDVPASVVQDDARRTMMNLIRRRIVSGVPEAEIRENRDAIYTEAEQAANERVKLGYILHRIADAEQLEASDEEVAREIELLAQRVRKPLEDVKKEIKENNAETDIRAEIRMEKAMNFVIDNAEIQTEGFLGRLISGVTGRKETT